MTKSDVSYASVPVAEPYVEGFSIGSSHAVTVIVDENDQSAGNARRNAAYCTEEPTLLSGSRRPIQLPVCPRCKEQHVRTRTRTYPSFVTWAGVVVSAAVCFPLFWVPLVVDPMKQTDHYCQSCGSKIGTVKALEGCFVKERS